MTVLEHTSNVLPNFIGGEWRRSNSSEMVDVFNPANAEVLARVPLARRKMLMLR